MRSDHIDRTVVTATGFQFHDNCLCTNPWLVCILFGNKTYFFLSYLMPCECIPHKSRTILKNGNKEKKNKNSETYIKVYH